MFQLRIVSPPSLTPAVRRALESQAGVTNLTLVEGAVIRPMGDLILCEVAAEATSFVIEELRHFGLEEHGSITINRLDYVLSRAAREAEEAAPGSSANAVVWEAVEMLTSESATLSASFVAFMVLASLIAAAGLLTDSLILIIGAMVVGPEFGPMAGVCVALVQRRWALARNSVVALLVGFAFAIAAACLAGAVLKPTDVGPDVLHGDGSQATVFISEPGTWSILVALCAAVAGILSLTSAKSGALIGVLISVTTIPAAANMGLALAYTDSDEFWGSAAQLGLNAVSIVVAGTLTLAILRRASRKNRTRFLRASAAIVQPGRRREPGEPDVTPRR